METAEYFNSWIKFISECGHEKLIKYQIARLIDQVHHEEYEHEITRRETIGYILQDFSKPSFWLSLEPPLAKKFARASGEWLALLESLGDLGVFMEQVWSHIHPLECDHALEESCDACRFLYESPDEIPY